VLAAAAELELKPEGAGGGGRLVTELERYMELARETPPRALSYQFCRLGSDPLRPRSAELEQEVQNVSKFFKR